MKFKWVVIGLLAVLGEAVYGCEVDCGNYQSKVLEPYNMTYFRAGEEIFRGQQEKDITWRDLFDPSSLGDTTTEVCKDKRTDIGACWGEPFEISIYDNGIVVEKGLSSDAYYFHGTFPATPSGITSGMNKEHVLAILGRAQIENQNLLEYELKQDIDYGRISRAILFFDEGKLAFISFRVWKGECEE